jgi:diguanylate cyclase (GGDEF)-like protein
MRNFTLDGRGRGSLSGASGQVLLDSERDPMTRLPGRQALERRLKRALVWATERGWHPAVVCIDLPRLKRINATLGRGVGDTLLQAVAARLYGCLRPGDTLARSGGGEFDMLLNDVQDPAQALEQARHILDAFRIPFQALGHEVFLTPSVGLSVFPEDGRDAVSLLRNARTAAFSASGAVAQDVGRFTDALGSAAFGSLRLEGDLWRAYSQSQLHLRYHPQCDLDGRLDMLEALLVWDHPELGRILPSHFIPIAEDCGMIVPIGEWVLLEACRQSALWRRASGAPVPVSVNVSAHEFSRPDFVTAVERALAATGLPPADLMLELTESTIMPAIERAVARMKQLHALGVKLAIDDFGVGYSSLGYLRRFPVDVLKIDRSFLAGVGSPTDTSPLVTAIVELAHAMGLIVVAEGIENQRQLEVLRAAGCDRMQGYLFARPLAAEQVETLLRARS